MAISPLRSRWFSEWQDLQDIGQSFQRFRLFSHLFFVHQVNTVLGFISAKHPAKCHCRNVGITLIS